MNDDKFWKDINKQLIGNPILTPIKGYVKQFFRSLGNLIKYFPIIWRDRDWDHFYFYLLMKKKLEGMRDYQKYKGHAINSLYTAERINLAITLLDKIIEDDFKDDEFWKDVKYNWISLDDEYSTLNRISKHTDEEILEQINKEHKLKRKYIKTFFSVLEKRIETFWD